MIDWITTHAEIAQAIGAVIAALVVGAFAWVIRPTAPRTSAESQDYIDSGKRPRRWKL